MKHNFCKLLLGAGLAISGLTANAQGLQGVVVENYHTTTQADADYYNGLGNGEHIMTAGLTTYRIFIDMAPGYKLNTVFGSAGNVFDFTSTSEFWNDDGFGAQFPPQTSRLDDGAAFDSWITIGRASRPGGAAGCTSNLEQLGVPLEHDFNGNLTMCNVWSGFGPANNDGNVPGTSIDPNVVGISNVSAFTDLGVNVFSTTGSWGLLPAQNGPELDSHNRVLIAQVTTAGTFSFHINISMISSEGGLEFYTHATSESGSTVSPFLTYPLVLPPDCNGVPGGPAQPGTSCDDGNANTGNDVYDANCVCAGLPLDCLGVPGGSAVVGTACNDGDANTGNDVYGANCVCAGQPLDCLGVPGGSAVVGSPCDDGNASTGNDVYGANCECAGEVIDCLGVAGGSALPGTPCDDANPNSSNDVYGANCVCAGTLANDCEGVPGGPAQPGTPCDDGDANTGNDVYGANCVCAGQPLDCLGVPGGSAVVGSPCDDGNASTGNDVYGANCECAGEVIDCLGVAGGSALPGTPCDDANPNSSNDVYGANCVCAGTLANDCEGVPGGPAQPGTPCDDGDANTGNDVYGANCVCAGQPLDCLGVPGGSAVVGSACNDGNANTGNDVYGANCVCAGQPIDCLGVPGGSAVVGSACNDGNANTGNDVYGANCVCAGEVIDCLGVVGGSALPGTACNDNDANTINDQYTANCQCVGTPIGGGCNLNELVLGIETDGVSTTLWEVRVQGTNALALNGGQLYAAGTFNESLCLADGCYYLIVTDDGGDGITGGGYVLKTIAGARIIDDRDNFSTGSISQIAGNQGFCLPLGNDRLITSSCDKSDWRNNEYVVANANPAVSAAYGVSNATSGYEIWFYNPNGGYSFRRFQSHSTANGLTASVTRACHFKINNWVGNQLQNNVLYNVRVRGRVNGVNNEWGAACRFILDPLRAQCPLTNLMDIAGNQYYSCNSTRNWGTGNYIAARPVSRLNANNNEVSANKYQFRFRLADETFITTRTSNNYLLNLQWAVNALQPGTTYNVDVRASFDNGATWCTDFIQPSVDPWGPICTLTINGGGSFNGGLSTVEEQASTLSMYPNPNRGDQVYVGLENIEEGVNTVSVDIYDTFGKRVSARTIAVQDGFINTVLELNGELAAGMYTVNIIAGNAQYTERLVIQP